MSAELLPQTKHALDVRLPEICQIRGERQSNIDQVGLIESPEGYQEFDSDIHDAEDIDHLSPEADITGRDYVRDIPRELPQYLNIVLDETLRKEVDEIGVVKHRVATQLATLLGKTLHYDEDDVFYFSVQEIPKGTPLEHIKPDDVFRVNGRNEIPNRIHKITDQTGLPFIFSDFLGIKFQQGGLDNTVAVKVNHVLEREVPRDIGLHPIGDSYELDTGDYKQLTAYNELLENHHLKVVGNLEQAGAHVVSIVADPRLKPHGFDIASADSYVAFAINSLGNKA